MVLGRRVRKKRVLPVFDALALVAFTLVGVLTHDRGLRAGALVRVGLPLLVAWFVAASITGAYRRPGLRTLLRTWIIAVPAAALVRTAIAGGPWGLEFVEFVGVAMAFTLLFLLLGRAIALVSRSGGRVVHRRR